MENNNIEINEATANTSENAVASESTSKVATNSKKSGGMLKKIVVLMIAILIISGFSNLFDSGSRKAEKFVKELYMEQIKESEEFGGADKIKIKTKTVGKNKDANLYAVDTTITIKDGRDKQEVTAFVFVYVEKDGNYYAGGLEYDKSTRKDTLEIVRSKLVRG